MSIKEKLNTIKNQLPKQVQLIAVSKTHPVASIIEAYDTGHRLFGENKVQELIEKHAALPKDIEWHLIGHLQTNKVKYIADFITLIHSVDSLKLLEEINKQAIKSKRIIHCLLQLHISKEDTKYGFSYKECEQLIEEEGFNQLNNIKIVGFMGMASNTGDTTIIRQEFRALNLFYNKIEQLKLPNFDLSILSMGMSSDYLIAIEEGANMIRVGSTIFGYRNYSL